MTTATLTLMRHAKSSWNDQQQADHDRPLNGRGNRDAPEMARRLLRRDSFPDLILCSSSKRTRETCDHLLRVVADATTPTVQYEESLYLASPAAILSVLADVPESTKHVMVLAHNPGIEDLSAMLARTHSDSMPTAAIRQFSCSSISAVGQSACELIFTDYPKSG